MSTLPKTITSPRAFVASLPAGFDGEFDWAYLIGPIQEATGRKITPMDIDCHVEIGGHHLIFETKEEGKEIPRGQRVALLQFWAKGHATVVFLWGKRFPIKAEIYDPRGRVRTLSSVGREEDFTAIRLIEFVYNWAKWADGHPSPFQYSE